MNTPPEIDAAVSQPMEGDPTIDAAPAPEGQSVIQVLGGRPVKLRPPPGEIDPDSANAQSEAADSGGRTNRYRILGEIGRGGMGAILKGHDIDLGRDVAVKTLLESHQDTPHLLHRFVEEARIAGQLQHPGIVPVYELGHLADQRLYFTMKLVRGRTLAQLLAERASPADDRPRFIKIFEQICQTLAYAHARGVIHRDLKPANVMVGAFGEVQVMDWGLAKVLSAPGVAAGPGDAGAELDVDEDDVDAADSHTRPGSVLGTPAYMPPEQARGLVDQVDERCDVFGLGAILCEILTGRPPYRKTDESTAKAKAIRADLADAWERLDACGDADLVRIAKQCLAPDRDARPRDGGALAGELTSYLNSVEQRLRDAELAEVEARAKADDERRRRELTVASQKELQRVLTRQVAERLEGELGRLEMVGSSLARLVEQRDDWEESHLVGWMNAMLLGEERIFGISLSFEPGQFRPGLEDYALYEYRGGAGGALVTKYLLPPTYPYRQMDWYRAAATQGHPIWTEPFVDTDGGDIPMVCYAVPFHRAGKVAGVVTLDLSVRYFERLGQWLKELDFGQRSHGFVTSKSGVIISHPDPAYDFASLAARSASPRTLAQIAGTDRDSEILTARINAEIAGSGAAVDPVTGRPTTWLFARVQRAGWTFVVVIDESTDAEGAR